MSSTLVDDARDRAFENLYERYAREVYRYVLGVLRNPAEAEDVTQTTFLNAYRALQAGERPQKPHNWLISIAHNACRSRARWAMRRPREVPLELGSDVAAAEAEPTNVRELIRALRRLPRNQRAAITMRELEGRSYPEIAQTLNVTVPAVEALIARARRTLRLQAAALRGLIGVQLPRSLRKLFENGDTAAGGMFGAGIAAKTAAVLFAGAVAGGLGYAGAEALSPAGGPAAPRPEPQRHAVVPAAAASAGPARRTPVPVRPAVPTAAAPVSGAAVSDAAPDSGAAAPGAPTAQPAASPREQASEPTAAVQSAVSAATTAAMTTTATIAATTPVATAALTATVAPVELPPPPEVPAPPDVPAPPLPPLPPLP